MTQQGVSQGFFVLADADSISYPMNNGCLVLQTTTANGRTAGHIYFRTSDAWVDVMTGGLAATFGVLSQYNLLTTGHPVSPANANLVANRILHKKTGIADASAASILRVTVPNVSNTAALDLTLLSSNGGTDAWESARVAKGLIVMTRVLDGDTVAVVATLALAQIATVGSGATHTLAYGVTSMTGAANAQQTFDVQVTIDDSGQVGSNQVIVLAELIGNTSGITMAGV